MSPGDDERSSEKERAWPVWRCTISLQRRSDASPRACQPCSRGEEGVFGRGRGRDEVGGARAHRIVDCKGRRMGQLCPSVW